MVDRVRSFNRTVTRRVGALNDRFLARNRPLGQSRLLWEIGTEGCEVRSLRSRLDQGPMAFHLLPATFTLTQLQEIYELLLGRRLHKASFRRSLHAAWLVEPTDEWRSEGRGRPAQLFRYAPKKRRGVRRGVRFGG